MRQDINITKLDSIRGCVFGGAVGDALGYSVEFLTEKEIFSKYGSHGITEYKKDPYTGKALISDDTQMTLFTAQAVLDSEKDPQTEAAKEYLQSLGGEGAREMVIYEESAHYPQFEEKEAFSKWMRETFKGE